jgi:DNA gyrase inhibitor GyrI
VENRAALSVEQEVRPNSFGVVNKVIPSNRCALARDVGSEEIARERSRMMKNLKVRANETVAVLP